MHQTIRNLLALYFLAFVHPAAAAPLSKWAELKVPPGSPLPDGRVGSTAVYDPIRNKMVLYGGLKVAQRLADYEYKGDVWTQTFGQKSQWTEEVADGGAGHRLNHSAIYDSHGDRMVVFGGTREGGVYLNDVWALSLSDFTWDPVIASGDSPPPRENHSAIYDEEGDRMIVFGGVREVEGGLLSFPEVWALQFGETNTWQRIDVTGESPGTRYSHAAVHVASSDWMVITGGYGLEGARNDVWALTLGSSPQWINLSPQNDGSDAPQGLPDGGCFDAVRNQLVCFGTCCPLSASARVWGFSLEAQSWTDLTPHNAGPSPRIGVVQIMDPVLDRMLVFGGTDGFGTAYNDTWSLKWGGPTSPANLVLRPAERGPTPSPGPITLRVFPNPVTSETQITYSLPSAEWVNLSVYDVQGRSLATLKEGQQEAGEHVVRPDKSMWSGKPSGIYFVKLVSEEGVLVKRALLIQ